MPDTNRDGDPSRPNQASRAPARPSVALGTATHGPDDAPTNGVGSAALDPNAPASASPTPRPGVAPPLLASEALIEDLAPVEPGRRGARLWCGAVGVGFTVLGVLSVLGVRSGGLRTAVPSFVLGLLAVIEALAPVPYRQRAGAMVILGIAGAVLGLRGAGPAMDLWMGGEGWGLLRVIAAVGLPAALLFRARYRAYRRARVILGVALLGAAPYAAYAVARLFQPGFGPPQVGALLALGAVAASLPGFMGAETTGAGTYTSPLIVVALAIDFAVTALGQSGLGAVAWAEVMGSAVAFAGTSAIASLGLFQVLAWRFAADARRIDLHANAARKDPPALSNSGEDWSTRS